jgi:ubiquinone/menaquinone biosynthesis C-methylase UbiE
VNDSVKSVQDGYNRWAATYDHDGNPLMALEEPVVKAALGDVRGLTVLDLGCGTGRYSIWLARAGAKVTAVDFSEGMLAEARKKLAQSTGQERGNEPVRFIAADLHKPLQFAGASYDLVVSGLVLEHLRELGTFFGEVQRVLKPGGRAVISAMHPAMFLRGAQARFTDPVSGEVVQPGSIAHSLGAIVMAAVGAGLQLASIVELAPDAELGSRYPRAERYIGWPMSVVLSLARDGPDPPRV